MKNDKIDNLDIYNKRMAGAIVDKLWFIQHLNTLIGKDKKAKVYDLGCADGELIRHVAPLFPNIEFIGIDVSADMIALAMQRQAFENERYINYKELCFERLDDAPVLLVMSSVWHEIVNYENKWLRYTNSILNVIQPEYIFFRDMVYNESLCRNSLLEDELKIYQYGNFDMIDSFKNTHSLNRTFTKQFNLVHFLLKYKYKENWRRELFEDYFVDSIDSLEYTFKNEFGYDIIFKDQFTLPYLKEQVKKDFDIDLNDCTHAKIIFKRNKPKNKTLNNNFYELKTVNIF